MVDEAVGVCGAAASVTVAAFTGDGAKLCINTVVLSKSGRKNAVVCIRLENIMSSFIASGPMKELKRSSNIVKN